MPSAYSQADFRNEDQRQNWIDIFHSANPDVMDA
jgi:hypothetical protein